MDYPPLANSFYGLDVCSLADGLIESVAAMLRERVGPGLVGIVVTGSRIDGDPAPDSDLDVIAVVATDVWQRRYMRHAGVDVDVTLGSRRYFEPQLRGDANMGLLAMFATGRVVADTGGAVAELIELARTTVAASRPALRAEAVFVARHRAWSLVQTVRKAYERSDAAGRFAAYAAASSLIDLYCCSHRVWLAGLKDVYRRLPEEAPDAWALLELLYAADTSADVLAAVESLARVALSPVGGVARYGASPAVPFGKESR